MKCEDEEDDEEAAGGGVDELVGADVTWLTVVERDFSVGRPCLSKYLSAVVATCSAVIDSTSLPMYSRMRGGRLLRTCSRRTWSTSTSLTSSLSWRRN